jgi:prolipoprotein diacylglyceryltransferase
MLRVPNLSFRVGAFAISAHFVFESLAYALGFALYRRNRKRFGDVIQQYDRNSIVVAAVLGAALGSKLLAALENPADLMHSPWPVLFGGKTIVGGLLGGTLAVEWVKRRLCITRRAGDLFTIPIALATSVGRIGCFFSGLDDHTYGSPTSLPWGMDFGDGIPRHPSQLYEIVFMLLLAAMLAVLRPRLPQNGELYRLFLVSYLGWRFVIDFLKPEPSFLGLSSIQWACALALLFYASDTVRMFSSGRHAQFYG